MMKKAVAKVAKKAIPVAKKSVKLKAGYEKTAIDEKLDKAQLKKGIKEGSKKDLTADKKMKAKYGYR